MTESAARRAPIVGTGLIGGSIGLGLRRSGWHVTGADLDPAQRGAGPRARRLDAIGIDPDAEITFVAVPVGSVVGAARGALARGGVVTDVGSVKAPVVDALDDPRFVGGHPMAGSEQLGVDGARADLFSGAVWVLTPTPSTDPSAHATVHSVVRALGAEVLTLAPAEHDALVAMVSHVPHLTAASLMGLAAERSTEHQALLRLAAGGFRDMTRIAAGDPRIWPDICAENRGRHPRRARRPDPLPRRDARGGRPRRHRRSSTVVCAPPRSPAASLPTGAPPAEDALGAARADPGPPGRAGRHHGARHRAVDVNIPDIEVAHSVSEQGGLLILVVDSDRAEQLAVAIQTQVVDRTVSIHELA